MKRKLLIPGALIAGLLVYLAVWSPWTPTPTAIATVSFLGYTNDSADRRRLAHSVPDNSTQAMALFQIQNRSPCILVYDEAYVELQRDTHWQRDSEQLPWTDIHIISASNTATVLLPTPTTQGKWRCRVVLKEVDLSSVVGKIRNAAVNLGVVSRKRCEVISPDVIK